MGDTGGHGAGRGHRDTLSPAVTGPAAPAARAGDAELWGDAAGIWGPRARPRCVPAAVARAGCPRGAQPPVTSCPRSSHPCGAAWQRVSGGQSTGVPEPPLLSPEPPALSNSK